MEQNQKPQCGAGVGPPCPVSALRSASRVQTKILIPTVLVKTQASYQTGGGDKRRRGRKKGGAKVGGEGRGGWLLLNDLRTHTHARTHTHLHTQWHATHGT